ncbi:MAG: prefoldin subunit beta [Candidatus Aenigmatarchaeota archaeon]
MQLPPQAQQLLLQMQTFQQQLQNALLQKETMQIQKIELESAKTELEKADEKEEVYKVVGPLLVKGKKSELKKEVDEKLEMIDMRAKSVKKQEEKLKERLKESQQKLQEIFKGLSPEGHKHGPDSEGMGVDDE